MNRLSALAAIALVLTACASPTVTPSPIPSSVPATPPPTPSPTLQMGPTPSPLPPTATPAETPSVAGTISPATISPAQSIAPETTLVTHDSFAATDSVISDFENQAGTKLKVLKGGDAGTMVNQAILTKSNPLGDVLYGVDNTFLSRALDAGIFVPYVSPAAASIPANFKLDPNNYVTPVDYGDVCVVYDARGSAASDSFFPLTINDMTQASYKSRFVVENPATSSPGLAFMLATIVRFGESGKYTWLDYWKDLRANDVQVANDWNDAYYNDFSGGGANGGRQFVVSYATDPASSMVGVTGGTGAPGVQFVDDGCFRQEEFVGVLAGAKNVGGAQAWVDFMASPEFQSDMPLNMYVLPVNPSATVPQLFTQFQSHATAPLTMDPATIAENRDKWIQQWTDAVLH